MGRANEAVSIVRKLCVLVVKNEPLIVPPGMLGMVGRSENVPAGGIAFVSTLDKIVGRDCRITALVEIKSALSTITFHLPMACVC